MQFQNPWGALAFLLVPLLILLYLLRRRYQEQTIPSVLLWEKAANQWEASHPWQKWRKNLLFFLQLIIICLLILAFMQPVFLRNGIGGNHIIILDVSMSMQAEEGGKSRIDKAKEETEAIIDQMQPGEALSILLAGTQNELLIAKSTDKQELHTLVRQVSTQNSGNALPEAIQLARSLQSEAGGETIHLLTDQTPEQMNEQIVLHNFAEGAPNIALTGLTYMNSSDNDTLTVLGILENYSGEDSAAVELWCDDTLMDVRDAVFDGTQQTNILFDHVPSDIGHIRLVLSKEDALSADNQIHTVVRKQQSYRVLLQTDRNIFLEKAIALREDIEVYKSLRDEALPLERYDLIIGDGFTKDILPEAQNIWLISPFADNDWITAIDAELSEISVAKTTPASLLFQHIDMSQTAFANVKGLQTQDPQTLPLLYNGDSILALCRDTGSVKQLAFGFDFHESNLPMKKDFPILVQNILAWFLPDQDAQTSQLSAGEPVPVPLHSEAEQYYVILPDQSKADRQTQPQFTQTAQTGFYRVAQQNAQGEVLSEYEFSVNALAGKAESDLYTASSYNNAQEQSAQNEWLRQSALLPLIAILALAVILIEWWVYHRGS